MTRAELPFVVRMLLRFVASEQPCLAGDLEEERRAGRSAIWFWSQLLEAVALTAWMKRRVRPTVVRLVTTTPYDRPDRSMPMVDPATINLSGTKVRSVGGLGLLAMVVLVSVVMPEAWFLVATGFSGGIVVGVFLVRRRRRIGLSGPPDQRPIDLFDQTAGDETTAQSLLEHVMHAALAATRPRPGRVGLARRSSAPATRLGASRWPGSRALASTCHRA